MAGQGLSLPARKQTSRLPTVTASEALLETSHPSSAPVAYGLSTIDGLLQQDTAEELGDRQPGLSRGRVTEIFGPPGVGKTTFCLQAATECLRAGHGVLWIDGSSQIVPARLKCILRARSRRTETEAEVDELLGRLTHYHLLTLAHFLALISAPMALLLPADTSLLVVDSPRTLIDVVYPRTFDRRQASKKNDQFLWAANRRQAVVADIASRLSSLAAVARIPILVTSGVVTKVSGASTAFLRPAISSNEWDDMLWARIVLFRDWADGGDRASSRFARIIKALGQKWTTRRIIASTVAFEITDSGAHEVPATRVSPMQTNVAAGRSKRPFEQVDASENDSDHDQDNSDNDYGWVADEMELAAEGLVDDAHLAARADPPDAQAEQQ